MNILGIIAEFNPLHTGHAYLIHKLRREAEAAFCVVAMSGDYVQRGEPAFFSKYLRTKAALLCGADLVLELPLSVSTGSAEYFALGAVSLLDRLGCITHLGFGSESGDIRAFRLAGELLLAEPERFQNILRDNLKAGMNFPKARYEALSALFGNDHASLSNAVPSDNPSLLSGHIPAKDSFSSGNISDILPLLESPNNILGTEYMKALHSLHSSIVPVTTRRIGAGYHENIDVISPCTSDGKTADAASENNFSCGDPAAYTSAPMYVSASGLRRAFLSLYGTVSPDTLPLHRTKTESLLCDYVPEACRPLYLSALEQKQFVTFDDLFLPLYHTLQYADVDTLSRYQDVTPEFSGRLLRLFGQCSSVTELCAALKAKNMTSARISRALLHILLHQTKEAIAAEKEQGLSLYARILGFRQEAKPLLSLIKKKTSVPLVSKLADAPDCLPPAALCQLQQTIKASELYRAALPGSRPESEYTKPMIIL